MNLFTAILSGKQYDRENLTLMQKERRKKYSEILRNAKNEKCQKLEIDTGMQDRKDRSKRQKKKIPKNKYLTSHKFKFCHLLLQVKRMTVSEKFLLHEKYLCFPDMGIKNIGRNVNVLQVFKEVLDFDLGC